MCLHILFYLVDVQIKVQGVERAYVPLGRSALLSHPTSDPSIVRRNERYIGTRAQVETATPPNCNLSIGATRTNKTHSSALTSNDRHCLSVRNLSPPDSLGMILVRQSDQR